MNEVEKQDVFWTQSRGTINFIDDRMLASMDKCKLSTRDAMHIVTATAAALIQKLQDSPNPAPSIHLKDLVLNRTTIHSMRREYRKRQANKIINEINVNGCMGYLRN